MNRPLARLMAMAAFAAALTWTFRADAAGPSLTIYFIDVEGGQSTLFAMPAGESLLVDTGYAGRDGARIRDAMRDAGLSRIDHLLITHFHGDHDGGITDLTGVPIGSFYDHGDLERSDAMVNSSGWPQTLALYEKYVAVRRTGAHVEPKVGTRLPLRDVEVTWVASARATIPGPLAGGGAANPECPTSAPPPGEPLENPRSTGFHLRYGSFRFIDLGDLSGEPLYRLLCPNNLLGPLDLYLVPHHGGRDTSYPATFAAFKPRVALLNNGATKGGDAETLDRLHRVRGLEDVWQLHRKTDPAAHNFADGRIANLEESTSHWIKVIASRDGSFSVTNGRTGETKAYPANAR